MYNVRQAEKYGRCASDFFTKRKFKHIRRSGVRSHYIEVFISDDIQYLVRISNHENLTTLSDKRVPHFNIVDDNDFKNMKKYFKRVYGYGDNNLIEKNCEKQNDDTRETINI
jgi:hypothetical protein